MSTDIDRIRFRLAVNRELHRPWQDHEEVFTVGEGKALLAALEKAEEERDAALDTLKRAQENWKHLADKAAKNLAEAEWRRDIEYERAENLLSQIEAANIALDLTGAEDCKLSLVERIEARQREMRRLLSFMQSATAAETLKRLPTISDPEIHEAMMEAERTFGGPGDEAEAQEKRE